MSEQAKIVNMVCPRCKKTEETTLDADEPPDAVLVEVPCPQCLDADDSLSMEFVFRNREGAQIWA